MVGTHSGGCGEGAMVASPTMVAVVATATHDLMQQSGKEIGKIC
jgi:hypothetical protein